MSGTGASSAPIKADGVALTISARVMSSIFRPSKLRVPENLSSGRDAFQKTPSNCTLDLRSNLSFMGGLPLASFPHHHSSASQAHPAMHLNTASPKRGLFSYK